MTHPTINLTVLRKAKQRKAAAKAAKEAGKPEGSDGRHGETDRARETRDIDRDHRDAERHGGAEHINDSGRENSPKHDL